VRQQQLLVVRMVAAAQHDGLERRDARGERAAPPRGRPRLRCDVHLVRARVRVRVRVRVGVGVGVRVRIRVGVRVRVGVGVGVGGLGY
jgi:hypothetical protein